MSDSPDIVLERSFYIGNALATIIYGLLIYITFQAIHLIRRHDSISPNAKKIYIVYSLVILLLMTFDKAANLMLGQMMWIEHRDVEGGPLVYFALHSTDWYNVMGSATSMAVNFLGDALLIHRCYLIWGSRLDIIAFPFLIYLASTSLAIVSGVQSALPGGFLGRQTTSFAVPWISLTSGLNFILMALIAGRILWIRKNNRALMPARAAEVYTGIIAIIIESALPFALLGIVLAVLLGKNESVVLVFTSVWGVMGAVSPMLIILRLAMGQGWTKTTATEVTTGTWPRVMESLSEDGHSHSSVEKEQV
ncbi:hypothetical protein K435DRAFT_749067 [Dendrothele bispora CBS 962.96]|uniref:Uncharacterized protein n=1 Tax=Dendrothele bispora (strain CBS 962.96) TaxID=1314807 RepID=A0A4S8MIX2_DENBC|nr:hypothetical protein K435DRAFT_749067 [Dendrothele bispora CBS 962.96]